MRQGTGDLQGSETTIYDSTVTVDSRCSSFIHTYSIHNSRSEPVHRRHGVTTTCQRSFTNCSRCTHAVAQEASSVYAVCLSCCCDRIFDNSGFGKDGSKLAHGVRRSSIMVGKTCYHQHWVGFPSSVKLSGPNQNDSESLGDDNTD